MLNAQAQSRPKDSKIIKYTTVALDTTFKHRNQNISVRLIVANDTSKIYYALMFCSNRNFNIQLLWSEDILY